MEKANNLRIRYKRKKWIKLLNIKSSSTIAGTCEFGYPERIYIGENSYVNGETENAASPNAKIIIGDNCLISYHVFMRTDMHNYEDSKQLIREQGHHEKSIVIGNDVWIGYGVKIMAGVSIGNGAVVASGAVVTHNIPPYEVWGGVPAKKIKERK